MRIRRLTPITMDMFKSASTRINGKLCPSRQNKKVSHVHMCTDTQFSVKARLFSIPLQTRLINDNLPEMK